MGIKPWLPLLDFGGFALGTVTTLREAQERLHSSLRHNHGAGTYGHSTEEESPTVQDLLLTEVGCALSTVDHAQMCTRHRAWLL